MTHNNFPIIGRCIVFLSFMLVAGQSTSLAQWQTIFSDNFDRSDGPLVSPWVKMSEIDSLFIQSRQVYAHSNHYGLSMYSSPKDSAQTVQLRADINFAGDTDGRFQFFVFGSLTSSTADGYIAKISRDKFSLYTVTPEAPLKQSPCSLLQNTLYKMSLLVDKTNKLVSIIIEDSQGVIADSLSVRWKDWPNGYFNCIAVGCENDADSGKYLDNVIFERPATTTVDVTSSSIPSAFTLLQNYPNPFNPSTDISFNLPSRSFVTLKVFDLLGREAATLVSKELPVGYHSQRWNAENMPSGIYFYRLQSGTYSETKKLLLLK